MVVSSLSPKEVSKQNRTGAVRGPLLFEVTMKIRMKTLMAGPFCQSRHPGEVCTLPRAEAAALVDAGFAECLEPEEVREEPKEIKPEQKKKK